MKPYELPIYQEKSRILQALNQRSVIVVESPTGSGKTTQLPLILYEAGYAQKGVIGVTQPRRIAAVSVSQYIATQLEKPFPGLVGYKMRFEDKTTFETKIKIMTDGTLLQEIKTDPTLSQYSVLIVDEAHERSLNIDFILGLLKSLLKTHPFLKVIISSATINAQSFSTYFDDAPVVQIKTQTFPIETFFTPPTLQGNEEALISKIVELVKEHIRLDDQGDVLVFLPGEKVIKNAAAALALSDQAESLWILPLYGRLSSKEQEKIFLPSPLSKTKIVLATNIAETSVTIDGITTVIDSGLTKMNFYHPKTFTADLLEISASQASCHQRKGRAGRTGPGRCYRLYAQDNLNKRCLYTPEEIFRTDLSEVVLRMSEIGIRDFERFDFLSPPSKAGLYGAIESLNLLNALNKDHSLSSIGQMMSRFPLLPRHSRMIVEAILKYPQVLREATIAATFLSTDSPFLLPQGQELEARRAHHQFRDPLGDFVSYLKIFEDFVSAKNKEQFCTQHYFDLKTMQELVNIQGQLEEILNRLGIPASCGGEIRDYLCAVAKGLIQFVCIHCGRGVYRSLTAEKISIHPSSVLFREFPPFIVAGEIVRTSRMFARSVSLIKKDWLNRIEPSLHSELLQAEKELASLDQRKKKLRFEARQTADQILIGTQSFKLRQGKGKQKIVVFEWNKLEQLLSSTTAKSFPGLKGLKAELLVQDDILLTGLKANKIIDICRKVNPRNDRVSTWPQGKTFLIPKQLKDLLPYLKNLVYFALSQTQKKAWGFLSLQCSADAQYWFRIDKSFDKALSNSLASLEELVDSGSEFCDHEELKTLNQIYRRLNQLL